MWRFLRIFYRDYLQTWISLEYFSKHPFNFFFLILRRFFEVIRYHPLGRLMHLLRFLVTRFLRNITERSGFHSLSISVLPTFLLFHHRIIRDELLYLRLHRHHLPHPLHSQWLRGEYGRPICCLLQRD